MIGFEYLTPQDLRDKYFEKVNDVPEYKSNGMNDFIGITLDFETGGLPDSTNKVSAIGITQVAMNAFRLKDLQMVARMSAYVYPYKQLPSKKLKKKDSIDIEGESMIYGEKALSTTNITINKLRNEGLSIKEVGDLCIDFIQENIIARSKATGTPVAKYKPFFLGQNITFDIPFWAQLMERSDNEKISSKLLDGSIDYYGNFQPKYIDTLLLAQSALCHKDNFSKYSLSNVCEHLGFPIFDAHDAGADTDATYNLFAYLASKMRDKNAVGDSDVLFEQEKERLKFKI